MVEYKIYTLENPIDGNIFYVGRTIVKLQSRLTGHLSEYENTNPAKSKIIKTIIANSLYPIIEEIDSCICRYVEDEDIADALETYWMFQLSSWGFNLVNKVGFRHRGGDRRRLMYRLNYKNPVLSEEINRLLIKYNCEPLLTNTTL